jgi:hypothetical protein
MSLRDWLPEKHRTLELIAVGLVGIYVSFTETRISDELTRIEGGHVIVQQATNRLIKEEFQAGVASALLPYLTCSAGPVAQKIALNILTNDAPKATELIASSLRNCGNAMDTSPALDAAKIQQQASEVARADEILSLIDAGSELDDVNLSELAAKRWRSASEKIQNSKIFIESVDIDKLKEADQDTKDQNYLAAVDIYKVQYQNIKRK